MKIYSISDFLEAKSASHPSFSPDNSKIAYLSNVTGTNQVYIVSIEGGQPEQLTNYSDPISFISFSPTENQLLFGKASGGNERTQFFLLRLDTREVVEITIKPDVRHNFGSWSRNGKKICFSSNERNGVDFDVYVMDMVTFETHCIYDRGGSCSAAGFSPQETYVTVRKSYSNVHTDLYLCNLEEGTIDHITPHQAEVFHASPHWLPDGSAFFLAQDTDREFTGLSRYALAERKFEYVFTPDWDIDGTRIDRNGKYLGVIINEDGYRKLRFFDPQSLKVLECNFPEGNVHGFCFSGDSRYAAFSLSDARRTTDIWLLDFNSKEIHQLTHSYQEVPVDVMVEPELVRYESFDGLQIPAFIYKPKDVSNRKVPALIYIHGGPEAQYQPGYSPITQYLVYSGYIVVAPNVRGSSGYGKTYLTLDNVEKRTDSVKDLVALREYLTTIQEIDTEKIVLYGGSYGGFMVLAGLAFYPELWAGGVDIVGIANFVTFLENTAPYRRANREAEYGSLEKNQEFLKKISPINSIENIKAPLFIIHGANDPRVPLSETEQIVAKLKGLDREVECLVYNDEGHGLSKLKNRLDAYPKVVAFLKRILGQ